MSRCTQLIGIAAVAMLLWSSPAGRNLSPREEASNGESLRYLICGPGNLYVDNQGTQGFIYNFGK